MSAVLEAYHLADTRTLHRLIDTGEPLEDGTTFDEPLKGVIYDGMDDEDIAEIKNRI